MLSMKQLVPACVLALATAAQADAQTRPATPQTRPAQVRAPRPLVEHGFLTLTAGPQVAAGEYSDRVPFEANAEEGIINAGYAGRTGLLVDGTIGVRVRRQIGLAVGVSRATRTGDASVSAEIPHPFFDDRHRTVEGLAPNINRTETAVHLQVYYDLRARGPWRVRLFAGPSFFDVEQELVTAVRAEETFPYDTAEFGSATTSRASGSGVGFNGGVDLSRMFTRRLALTALLRYAQGSVDLNAPGSRTVSTDGGGLQAAAGLRLLF